MSITKQQLAAFDENGLLFLPSYFSEAEVDIMKAELPHVFADPTPRKVMEDGGGHVRSVYGAQSNSETLQGLSRHVRIVEPAMEILGSDVYVYQFKINAKAAFGGDLWEWHQDYIYWQKEDGMPEARAANCIIFLDEVNEFNGPLFFIPGSHKEGVIEVTPRDPARRFDPNNPGWLSTRLKFALDRETVAEGVARYGIVAPKGPAGSVLFTHPNIFHCSPNNMSPFDRVVAIITYNSVENIPVEQKDLRPEFLCSRDLTPVIPLAEEAWANAAGLNEMAELVTAG